MEIRAALAADQSEIEAVAAGAFEEETDGRIVRLLRALADSGALRVSLVAVAEGEIVGHVALSCSWVDARERLVDVLVLSPLSVRPDSQRAGIGTALIAAALAEAERLGAPAVFLEGGWDYYGSRGFSAATPLGFTAPSSRIPLPAFQVARLSAYEAWMTGAFVYCDAFWAHDAVGLRDPLLAQVEAHSGHAG
ncbi:N-acetyltransferase [Nocardioides sp. NPDC127503]|uniref:GNAT family N-acetyltransferase n=1 Tax=Nocardioides sp. NPDC127503 TaxID=3154516 RepID=UPI00331C8647